MTIIQEVAKLNTQARYEQWLLHTHKDKFFNS